MRLECPFCKGKILPAGCLPPSPASCDWLESTSSVLLSRSVEMPVGQIRNFTCFKQLWPLTKVVLKIWLFKGKFFWRESKFCHLQLPNL